MKDFLATLGIVWAILAIIWVAFHPPRALMMAVMFVSVFAVSLIVEWATEYRRTKSSKGRAE